MWEVWKGGGREREREGGREGVSVLGVMVVEIHVAPHTVPPPAFIHEPAEPLVAQRLSDVAVIQPDVLRVCKPHCVHVPAIDRVTFRVNADCFELVSNGFFVSWSRLEARGCFDHSSPGLRVIKKKRVDRVARQK